MLGPFATTSRLTPIHQMSLAVLSRIVVHDNDDNDNAWQRGPLWPHGMGPMTNGQPPLLKMWEIVLQPPLG